MDTKKIFGYLVLSAFMILLFTPITSAPGASSTYPTKAVTFVVPFPPGGRTDITARVVAEYYKNYLGQPVVVVNKAGAGGVLGAKEVAMAIPDGYTLGFFSKSIVQLQYGVPTPADLKEYEYVGLINMDPSALAVSLKSGINSVKELVEYCKKNPGEFMVSITRGALADIDAEGFARAAGIKFRYMPFRGGAERKVALAGGHVDAGFDVPGSLKPLADGGKIKILGVGSEKRVSLYKEIPTLKEEGVDVILTSWHGIFAPKGTPADVLKILEIGLEKTAKDPGFIALMEKSYLGILYMNRAEFVKFLQKEDKEVKKLVEILGEIVY